MYEYTTNQIARFKSSKAIPFKNIITPLNITSIQRHPEEF